MADPALERGFIAPFTRWLRVNLGVTLFVLSLCSGAIGTLVSGTLGYARYEAKLGGFERVDVDLGERVSKLESINAARDEQRVKILGEIAAINQRLAVLEQQSRNIPELASGLQDMDTNASAERGRLRHESDLAFAALSQRIAVLESQVKWFGDRVPNSGRSR